MPLTKVVNELFALRPANQPVRGSNRHQGVQMTIMHIVKNSTEFPRRVAGVVQAFKESNSKRLNLILEKSPKFWRLWNKADMPPTQIVVSADPAGALREYARDRVAYSVRRPALTPIPLLASGKLPRAPRTSRTTSRFDAASWRFPGRR